MNIYEILRKDKDPEYQRKTGKYWCSELWAMKKGYLKPADLLKEKEINNAGLENIFWGEALESYLVALLGEKNIDCEYQKRYEIFIEEGITLTVKPDFEFKDYIIEFKCPVISVNGIPDKWKYQLEAEYQATKKTVILGVFQRPIAFFEYKPSEETWDEIKKILKGFHSKVVKLNETA